MILFIELCLIIMSSSAQFIEVPTNISATIGDDVTFRCSAGKSVEPIVYSQWKSNTGSLLGYHQEGVLPGHQGRYSYIKQNSEQLHLKIEHVTLDDDGKYECQMLHPEIGPIRAKAFLNILVPPVSVHFSSYQPNSVIPVKEETQLNITCVVPNVKPEPRVLWYIDGKKFNNNSPQISVLHLNKTFTVFNSLVIRAGKDDHGKTITCEVTHEATNTKTTANATLNVLFPPSDPTVSIKGRSDVLESGDNVTISCVVTSGNPSPDLFWYHEKKRLPSFFSLDAHTKEIKNDYTFTASPEDNMADYECRANNSHTTNYKKATLHLEVKFPPSDVELFGESSIRYGRSTMIQCKSLPSNPASQITWKINGRAVPTTTQREQIVKNGIVSSSNITVHPSEIHDAKHQVNVECAATNDKGTTIRQHVIKIIAPPKMPTISGLDSTYFFEGDVVNVTCEAKGGNPLAELAWFRGNEKINGAYDEVAGVSSFSSLSLRLDRSMNSQRLKCEAINAAIDEPLIESRQLTVYYPPRRVLIKPAKHQDPHFSAGQTARLVCEAFSSNPAAQISWKFSRETDSDVNRGDMSLNKTTKENSFDVENVISFVTSEDDDGSVVYCIASHPDWKHTVNTSYSLNVLYPPKMLVKGDINVILSEGESFKENLTIKSNPPISSWQWRKNGILFDHTIGRVFARGAVLSGRQLLSTDAGAYTLTATNSIGSTNITIKLVVEYSARITSISTPIIAAVGDTVLLECEADAEPQKSEMINWYKNGIILPSTHKGNKKAIVRLNATQDGSGEFICKADNGVGVPAESKTFVLVNSAPKLRQIARYSKTAGTLGGTAKAKCEVHAVPNVDFVWEKNGQVIKANNSKYAFVTTQLDYSTYESTLWIKNIVPDDYTKKVKCIARNNFGADAMFIPIVFPTNPEQPSNLLMVNSTTNTISVSWEPGFDGGSEQIFEVKYRKDNEDIMHLVNTTHTHLRVSGLTTANAYSFQLRSINSKGFASSWTNPVIFSTLNENGINIAMIKTQKWFWVKYIPYLLIIAVIFMLAHVIVCCFLCNRTKKRKLREKTEQVRAAIKSDVRQVQMYGAMAINDDMSHLEFDEKLEMSEDEHSVRTMIEVSPNGYMQPIEPTLYEKNGILKYNFDTRNYGSPHNTSNRSITYANVPYPEPPQSLYFSNCSHQPMSSSHSPQHNLSTFINPNLGVRTGPINYTQLDGDLV